MGEKPFKIFLFMKRKPGMSVEDFRDYYENHHIPLCMKYSQGVSRYIRRYIEPQPHAESGTNEEMPYDVITELGFDDEQTWKATVDYISTSVMPDDVVEDEAKLFHRPTMRMATVVECETPMPAATGQGQ